MSETETKLAFVDGRNALAYVLLMPGSDADHVVVDAGANGMGKIAAAHMLRQVADIWDPPPTVVEQGSRRAERQARDD